MRNLFKLLAIISITALACSSDPKDTGDEILPDTAAIPGKSFAADLDSDNPVQIDSSEYVMYPLANKQRDDDGRSFISKDKFNSKTYWNIIFYNTITRKSHLLNEKRKMVILSYNQNRYDSYSSDNNYQTLGVTQAKDYILYSVISSDFNKDGRLDHHDPEYLFISDKQGNNFKQISPNDKNVLSWQLIEKSGTVLINTVTDKKTMIRFLMKKMLLSLTHMI